MSEHSYVTFTGSRDARETGGRDISVLVPFPFSLSLMIFMIIEVLKNILLNTISILVKGKVVLKLV